MAHSTTHTPLDRLLAIAIVLLIAVALAMIAATLPELPAAIATHFGLDGRANGWMTRDGYARVIVVFTVGFPIAIWAMVALAPRRFPRFAKIPNRDVWLSPAHRAHTLERLDTFGRLHALGAIVLPIGLHWLVIAKNVPTTGSGALVGAIALLAIAVAAQVVTTIALKRAFRRPP
ncbi:MAG: DUF1648 domain-containing protein [Proteobacteria bacterium]|jgi:hypothetical protein|nr:DUF1648 domain-containing protein [Pseudomonadota bacterium]